MKSGEQKQVVMPAAPKQKAKLMAFNITRMFVTSCELHSSRSGLCATHERGPPSSAAKYVSAPVEKQSGLTDLTNSNFS